MGCMIGANVRVQISIFGMFWMNHTDEAQCFRNVESERRVAGFISSLVNARSLPLECARLLHETLFITVLMYGSERMIQKDEERSRIRDVQMNNLRGLLGIRRMGQDTEIRLLLQM